jgi:signal transduction histidine kinase
MAGYLRKGLRLVGPYPYNPYLIFLFFSSIFLSRFSPLIALVPAGSERWRIAALVILASSIPGLLFAGGAILLKRYRFWSGESTFLYILEVAFFQYLNLLAIRKIMDFLTDLIGDSRRTLLPLNFNVFVSTVVLGLITLALMHQAERKIIERLTTANDLVVKLQAEREDLVHSDENLRRQTSQFLHDRVQSDLMVVGIKLKSILGKSSPEVNEVIDRAILRLENTRASDLKDLIQVLTPNLDAGSLHSALDVLLDQYRPNMEVSLKIDDATEELDAEVLLGIFRIVEQSILNSLMHGPANRVQISVSTDSVGVTDIVVSDDGPGISVNKISAGVGTAIIDSWVGILNGSKEIDSAPGHGYQLHVTFIAR